MRLATVTLPGDPKTEHAAEVRGDEVVLYDPGITVLDVVSQPPAARATAAGPAYPLADVALRAPIARPRSILGIGLNYLAHAQEQGKQPPELPIVFAKLNHASAPPSGPVVKPAATRCLDYEGELAVVMGPDHTVAGYAVADDVSARDLQRAEPHWVRAKGADTFCPWGPWITTADEVPEPENLRLRTWVNGDLRQDARTSDLIFGIDELVAFITATCTLDPGDLILTGTPSGVGMAMDPRVWLEPGDVVRIEIESLGVIEHPVVAPAR